ncbi:mixed lineage kinase domain-like protein [Spea bombifrons]|uniref:mixed lineage kinase domain-like protein n=1 Tax=Spea bombifrons TaxID=233779 RepID=UPI0023493CF5|nr:mixed lineage kinase domain-like protein [Spea bombifrons]
MEALGNVLQIAETIYSLCEKASSNKQQCSRLQKRIQMLLLTAKQLRKQSDKSEDLNEVLMELELTLRNARCWVAKYSQRAWWRKVLQANGIREEFDLINDRLKDAAENISLLMVAEQRGNFLEFFDEKHRKRQNQKDIDDDLKDLKDYLTNEMRPICDKVDHVAEKLEDADASVNHILKQMEKLTLLSLEGIRTPWNIAELRVTDLKRGELVIEKPTHYLYRGEYHKGPVAIKVLKGQLIKDQDFVKKTFQAEIKTMKKFECVNILRLYGICIDNSKSEPCYSLVMEFCEKGTLRDLLNREKALSWMRRVHMVLDAARALYRLHQTELKAILHGSLSSSKFLVDGTYCLKLSGFELSKTESSMRKSANAEKRKESIEWAYIAPETLENINAYDKRSEVYSLGVVFYEIASGKVPLEGLPAPEGNLDEIHQKLRAEVEAGLPSDCPAVLCDIIKKSVESDPNNRLTAGVIVDLLMSHLNQQDSRPPSPEASV